MIVLFFLKELGMKNWKKLLFTALMSAPTSVMLADSCEATCDTGCCTTDFNPCCGGGHQTNKTVYVDVGFGASGTYLHENFFRNELMNAVEDGWGGAFQAVVFGGRTTDAGSNGLGRRFGFGHRRCFIASDTDFADFATTDIDVSNFNVATAGDNYASTICLCPRQSIVGALLSWKQALCSNDEGITRWWFEINAPIVTSKHTMGLVETLVNDGGAVVDANGLNGLPFVATVAEGFAEMTYGKIDNACHENTELANIEFKIGYNSLAMSDCCRFGSYVGVAAPTTKDRTAVFAFEPIVGQEHWALMWGSTIDFNMCEWENSCLSAHFAIDSRWWFEREEKRTFDLVNKSWGRYQAMYASLAEATEAGQNPNTGTFGTSILTRCVDVTPGYQIDFNTGLMWKGCKFMVEIGHTFYARQAEEICPNWYGADELPAIKAFAGGGETNSVRTIGKRFSAEDTVLANYANNAIHACDVDWNAGSHEGVLAHSLYGSLGYEFNSWCYPTFLAIGGAYDFGIEDAGTSVMRRWNVFGKLGFSF